MLSQAVERALNEQINAELYSSYLYLAMSAAFESASLPGFARWMRHQSDEERGHAMRLFDYVHDRAGRIELREIASPPAEFESPLEAFRQALEHERKITASIHRLYETAASEADYATQTMLQWFITEQVEEEKTAGDIVERLQMAGDHAVALLLLDGELGTRGAEA